MSEKSEPILGVEDLLGRLRVAGEQESSGTFTLDPKKALERLAEFALPSAEFWILKVVQSLHRSGAKSIYVNAGVNKVLVRSDVVPQGLGSMDDLLTHLLTDEDKAEPALRHLAAGLQGSLAVQPSRIKLTTRAEGICRDYLLKSGGWTDGAERDSEEVGEQFELSLNRNMSEKLSQSWFVLNTDIFDLFFRRKGAMQAESFELSSKTRYTQCKVQLGRKEITNSPFGAPRFKGYDISSDPDPGKAKPQTLRAWFSEEALIDGLAHAHHHLAEMVEPSADSRGFRLTENSHASWTNRHDADIKEQAAKNGLSRAYAIRMELEYTAKIEFWEDGVMVDGKELGGCCPGLFAIIDARGLAKDVGGVRIRDEDWKRLTVEIKEAGEVLRKKILENIHLMPGQERLQRQLRTS